MKRSAFLIAQSIALVGAVLLAFNLAGCGTMAQPMSVDASAGLIPSGRGAP
jgi:predicted small secreted protein